jgi:hypothetical protein
MYKSFSEPLAQDVVGYLGVQPCVAQAEDADSRSPLLHPYKFPDCMRR